MLVKYLRMKKNPRELIRLLLCSGRLLECSKICREYLWAALGRGKEYYGLQNALVPTGLPMCVPIYHIDKVVKLLYLQGKKQQKYKIEYDDLKRVYKKYLDTSHRVSNDMQRIAWQNA